MEYVVYSEEQGEIKSFKTLQQAKTFIKELKKIDKEEGIFDIYSIQIIDWSKSKKIKNVN